MFPLSLEAKLIAWALAIAGALGGLAWFIHHERDLGASNVRTEVAAATAAQKAADDAETQRRVTEQQGIVHDAQLQASAAHADAARADGARDALRVQLATFVAANRRAGYPATPAGSAPAGDPIGVLAEVLGATDDFAGRVAAEADANRIAGLACERAYDALSTR